MDIKIDNQLTENTKEKKPNQPNSTFCNQDTRGKKKEFFISVLIDLRAGINAFVNTNSLCNGAQYSQRLIVLFYCTSSHSISASGLLHQMHNSSFFLSFSPLTFHIYSKDKNIYEKNKCKCFC